MSRAWSLVLLAALLSACSAPATAQPGPTLVNTAWVVSQLQGKVTLSSARPTIEFGTDQATGLASCNRYGASYQQAGTKLSFGQLTASAMACLDQAVMSQESAFVAALAGIASVRAAEDGLELLDATGVVLLKLETPPPAAPDRPLVGTGWELDSIVVGETASSAIVGSPVTLQLQGEQLIGKACNNYRASVKVDGSTLTIGPVASTKMACRDEALSEQERMLFELLPKVTSFSVNGDRLTLATADGSSLGFVAK